MKIATAYVEMRADKSKMSKDLADVESDVKGKASSAAKTFASIFGAAAFGAVIKGSIDAASDLNETVSKTKTLFGQDSEAVIAFAATTAKSMGMSKTAYLDAAAGLKGLLDNLGLAPAQATEWSQKLTALGADLGSFFNKDPAEAVAAIGSAMRGEAEPIRAFNVQINDAAIKAEAMKLGLYDGVGAMDANAKAQGTLSLIMAQTTAAQGDFAKTADGAANSQRIAKAVAADSAASLGQAFLPIYTKVVQVVTAVAEGFGKLPAPIQVAIVALAGLVALSGPIKSMIDMAKGLGTAIQKLGPTATSAASGLGVLAGVAMVGLSLHAKAAADRAKEVAEAIDGISRATSDAAAVEQFWQFLASNLLTGDDAMKKLAESNLEGAKRILEVGAAAGIQQEAIDLLRIAVENEDAARAASAETTAKYATTTDAAIAPVVDLGAAELEAARNTDLTREATERHAASLEAGKAATEDLTEAIDDESNAFTDLADAASELQAALDQVFGATQSMEEADRSLRDEVLATKEAIKENGRTLDIATEKGRANREQVQSQATAIIDYGVAMVGAGKSNKEASDNIAWNTGLLRQQLIDAGVAETAVDDYITTLGLTPENVATAIELVDDQAAKDRLGEILTQLGDISAGAAAEIQALIDEGKFTEAERRLTEIARRRGIYLDLLPGKSLRLSSSGVNVGMVAVAAGGLFDRATPVVIGEAGREVALPLTKPSRLAALLADPAIGGPISAAMPSGSSAGPVAGSTGPLFTVGAINGSEAMRRHVEASLNELAAEIMAGRL